MRILTSGLALAAIALTGPAQSQDWPQRQVTIVVPFSAGGTTDMFARILAQGLQQKYGTPFVVDNRAGAGGNIGAAAVARAATDGNTLLVGTVSTHAINPFIYKNLAYDTRRISKPVSLIARLPKCWWSTRRFQPTMFAELIEHLKKNPGNLSYGSSGAGTSTHLASSCVPAQGPAPKMLHVPYRSSGDVMNALIGGHIDLAFDNITLAWPHAKAGAVARAGGDEHATQRHGSRDFRRLPAPCPASRRPPGMASSLPPARRARSSMRWPVEVKHIFDGPEVRKTLFEVGAVPSAMTPEQFVAFITAERRKWRDVVQAAGVEVQ